MGIDVFLHWYDGNKEDVQDYEGYYLFQISSYPFSLWSPCYKKHELIDDSGENYPSEILNDILIFLNYFKMLRESEEGLKDLLTTIKSSYDYKVVMHNSEWIDYNIVVIKEAIAKVKVMKMSRPKRKIFVTVG